MRNSAVHIAERQKRAVQTMFGEIRLGVEEAAASSGSTELELRNVFTQLCKKPFAESLEIFDVNKPFLAAKCRELLKDESTKPADKITLMKMLLKTMGETTEEAGQTVNVNTPKALVLVGSTKKQLNAMLAPRLEAPDEVNSQG